jgi:hypothetical protein
MSRSVEYFKNIVAEDAAVRENMYKEPTSADFFRLLLARMQTEYISTDPERIHTVIYELQQSSEVIAKMFQDFTFTQNHHEPQRSKNLNNTIRKMIKDKELVRFDHDEAGRVFTMPDVIRQSIQKELRDLDVAYISEINATARVLTDELGIVPENK